MSKLLLAKVSNLRMHPNYAKIYSVHSQQREILKESIVQTKGLLEPIVINEANVIIHGAQRFLAYKEMGWKEIPAKIFDNADDQDEVFCMISYNRHKDKTMLERWNEISYLKKLYKKRQGERTDLKKGLSEFDKLSTRKKVALHCNIAEANVYKIEKVAKEEINLLNLISAGEMSLHEAYVRATGKCDKTKTENDGSGSSVEEILQHVCPNCDFNF